MKNVEEKSPLGKTSQYVTQYDPTVLFPIPRKLKRDEISVPEKLPFQGVDIWNAFEISCLNMKGKPQVALAEFRFPCTSRCIIESKSFKLYLNSFNQTKMASMEKLKEVLQKDLSAAAEADVGVNLITSESFRHIAFAELEGECIDDLDIDVDTYEVDTGYLKAEAERAEEVLMSNLLKSNCLVTGQPDWASVQIRYSGPKINREGLLKYLISFREHNEFHEQCVERIFMDISRFCEAEKLSVYARYTRRGGLDINPHRSNYEQEVSNIRTCRQ